MPPKGPEIDGQMNLMPEESLAKPEQQKAQSAENKPAEIVHLIEIIEKSTIKDTATGEDITLRNFFDKSLTESPSHPGELVQLYFFENAHYFYQRISEPSELKEVSGFYEAEVERFETELSSLERQIAGEEAKRVEADVYYGELSLRKLKERAQEKREEIKSTRALAVYLNALSNPQGKAWKDYQKSLTENAFSPKRDVQRELEHEKWVRNLIEKQQEEEQGMVETFDLKIAEVAEYASKHPQLENLKELYVELRKYFSDTEIIRLRSLLEQRANRSYQVCLRSEGESVLVEKTEETAKSIEEAEKKYRKDHTLESIIETILNLKSYGYF